MTKPAGPLDVNCRTASRAESNTKSADATASNEVSDSEELTYPEGGVEGWGMVLGSFCAMVSVFGLPNTAAVFESYFSEHQVREYTPSQIGWIFSIYLFVTYLFGILAGPIFDKHGYRIYSLVILSFCDTYYQLMLTFSVLAGLGASLLNTPAFAIIRHWFNSRRSLAMGIAATGGSIGGIVFPLVLQVALPKLGFAWSMRLLALSYLVLAIPTNLFLRTRLPPSKAFATIWPDFHLFKDLKFLSCCGGIFFMEYGVLIPLTYIVSFSVSKGQTANASYVLPILLNTGSVVGRVVPGFVSDRIGRFNTIILTVGLCTVSVFALWLPAGSSWPTILAFTFIFGFASGGNLCDSRDYGRFLSTAMLSARFGTLTGIPL
ncbi:major facilitator superfamily domain-containing protein [Colletotrichum phormii]|uniref:Major facilitator superfamily domain-containing protein n=1 Tax=Colletotrichum phormii TaxID=359342 RepID=A0AAJ0EAE1_9PEZI|nr:major facilitator superfamily domain-containing protein [Colletotrichum phormii]KAK1623820.1 major facilitator superfamily domain-containing protein [Colletotrichum phormii]